MKILVMGAGKMGSFFLDLLSFEHETAVFEKDRSECALHIIVNDLRRWMK